MTALHKTLNAQIALRKTPTTGTGEFEALIATWAIDHDNERFDRHAFDQQNGAGIPVSYQHVIAGDLPGGVIGEAVLRPTDGGLLARGRLDLKGERKLAEATYERMLLPKDDPRALHEFSVGFTYQKDNVRIGPKGERVITKATVIEMSVVYRGAQVGTELLLIKADTAIPQTYSVVDAIAEIVTRFGAGDDLRAALSVFVDTPDEEWREDHEVIRADMGFVCAIHNHAASTGPQECARTGQNRNPRATQKCC